MSQFIISLHQPKPKLKFPRKGLLILNLVMEMNSNPSVWFETENEDDTFYAEIKRQILQLTSEDHEDLVETNSFKHIDVTNDGSNRSIYNYNNATKPTRKFYLWETDSSGSPPIWLTNLWRNGKGTGVFIPQVSCKENQRPGTILISYSLVYFLNSQICKLVVMLVFDSSNYYDNCYFAHCCDSFAARMNNRTRKIYRPVVNKK